MNRSKGWQQGSGLPDAVPGYPSKVSRAVTVTRASHSPGIARQVCRDKAGPRSSQEGKSGPGSARYLGSHSHGHNLAEARIMGKKMQLPSEVGEAAMRFLAALVPAAASKATQLYLCELALSPSSQTCRRGKRSYRGCWILRGQTPIRWQIYYSSQLSWFVFV